MGFNIKNNYGPNIEVNAGGKVTLVQGKNGLWTAADAEEAEYEEVAENDTLHPTPDDTEKLPVERDNDGSANDYIVTLPTSRQSILDQLLSLTDKGDWVNGITAEDIKAMLKIVLGQGETPLSGKEAKQSGTLWHLLENGRGNRVVIVWQNMVGYLDDKKLFRLKGSPALNKDFFGDDKGYTNIDKGRPSKGLMTADFESIIPLLDAYVPRVGQ